MVLMDIIFNTEKHLLIIVDEIRRVVSKEFDRN